MEWTKGITNNDYLQVQERYDFPTDLKKNLESGKKYGVLSYLEKGESLIWDLKGCLEGCLENIRSGA